MRHSDVRCACTFFAVALLSTLAGCQDRPTDTTSSIVKAAYVPAGFYLPFLMVEEHGLLAKRGYSFELVPFNNNSEMISLFLNGKIDVTAQSCLTMFPIEAKTPNLFKFIYGQYNNSMFFVVPADSPIQSLDDLRGKTIGTWSSPSPLVMTKLLLKRRGMRTSAPADYSIVTFAAPDVGAALQHGNVDAIFIFDSVAASMVASGEFRYVEENAMDNLIAESRLFNGGGFIRTKLIAEEPAKAKAIRDAFSEALEIIRKDPEAVYRIVEERLKLEHDAARAMKRDVYDWPNEGLIESAKGTLDLLVKEDNADFVRIDIEPMFLRSP